MALATVSLVKQLGGLQASDDYNLFRYSSPDELDAAITRVLGVASAWVRSKIPTVYSTTDADTLTLLAEGEGYLALYYLTIHLKSRKVFGTHWALDQEGSDRFEELIDVEYKKLAEDLLGPWLTVIEEPGQAFARPTLMVGPVINLEEGTTVESEGLIAQEISDRARSLVAVP